MSTTTSKFEETPDENIQNLSTTSPFESKKWPVTFTQMALLELKKQRGIAIPLVAMNLTYFTKVVITTAFLGRLGELQLAGGALGSTFANVTGFSLLTGLSGAMEPICGQAYGAKNYKLLHKSITMTICLLLATTIPISFIWLNVDNILIFFGQNRSIAMITKKYLFFMLPDLVAYSFLCPLKAYLSSQSLTMPVMLSSLVSVAIHVPVNIFLMKANGLEGVAIAFWITDLVTVVLLVAYVVMSEIKREGKWKEGGWWEQSKQDWIKLLKLSGPCCLTTCLEWWCYEALVLITGWLPNAKQSIGVLAVVLNFDYLVYAVQISLATSASTRVSNELGANQPVLAYQSACVSLALSLITGCFVASITVLVRGKWGRLFSHDKGIRRGVKKMMLLMALVELGNFPLIVCGGIVRGTARPWLGTYANLGGFFLVALPLSVVLAFKVHLGLGGLLVGFFVGIMACLIMLLMFVARIDWGEEAGKAQVRIAS